MHHFIFEFITGGGLSSQALSKSLIKEGEIMMQTLLSELSELDDVFISLSRDSRLELCETKAKQYDVDGNIEEKLPSYIEASDVSWLIAPETDGCLEEYAKLFVEHGKLFIGSSSDAIKLASSKYLTNKVLSEAGVNVVETNWLNGNIPKSNNGWVIKPNDGVGGEGVCLVYDNNDLAKFIDSSNVENLLIQPYLKGKHMSMSLLVFNGDVRLLACNEQHVEIVNDSIKLLGIGVNECLSYKDEMLKLASDIVSSINGLAGYIGVDLLAVDNELIVLEVNPRFTTAYAGISKSISCNVSSKILDTFLNGKLPEIKLESAIPVRINV